MRYVLSAAVAAAICGMSINLAVAEPSHNPGDPNQSGNTCWVSTNADLGFGYWKECAPAAKSAMHKKKSS
jgi:hypothetical protein